MKLLPFCTWLPCLLVFSLCLGCECGALRRTGWSKRDLVRAREAGGVSPGACGTRLPRGKRSVSGPERLAGRLHARFSQPGDTASTALGRNSVYFSGRDQLRLKPSVEVPRGNFTLEMWIKPEGGQRSPSVIAGLLGFTAPSTFRCNPDIYWLHCALATCKLLFVGKNM